VHGSDPDDMSVLCLESREATSGGFLQVAAEYRCADLADVGKVSGSLYRDFEGRRTYGQRYEIVAERCAEGRCGAVVRCDLDKPHAGSIAP
jgi:hypothetical protein